MADDVKAAPQGGDSMKSVQALGIILIVILGIFMVTSLNKVNAELVRMNQQMGVLATTSAQNTLAGFQAVSETGEVQWKFAPVPVTEMPGCGMGGEACQSGAAGTCASGTAGATCGAAKAGAETK